MKLAHSVTSEADAKCLALKAGLWRQRAKLVAKEEELVAKQCRKLIE